MARTRIKICGVRDEETAFAAADAGADAIGLVFYRQSPRYIEPEEAWQLVGMLPPFVASVGLFVNAALDAFMNIEETCPTDLSQLHGQEPEDLVRHCGPNVIKAVRFDPATIDAELKKWERVDEVDAILVDGSAGGQGTSFDWSKLAAAREQLAKPLILAGGLTPENVGEAIRIVQPFAVDVSSGVESSPGVKEPDLIEAFCRAVRRADSQLDG
jgi:phosphoribosylanthranilate isomerase